VPIYIKATTFALFDDHYLLVWDITRFSVSGCNTKLL